jgi:hypothetical protein
MRDTFAIILLMRNVGVDDSKGLRMAEQFIEEIYSLSMLVEYIKEIIEFSQKNLYAFAMRNWSEKVLMLLGKLPPEKAAVLPLQDMLRATEKIKNPVLFTDILEGEILPKIIESINGIGKIDAEDDGYRIQSSKSGFLTLVDENEQIVFHGLQNPMWDAHVLAQELFDANTKEYAFIGGVGLGYLPFQIYEKSHESVRITIYEPDKRMIDYSLKYGVLEWIPEDDICIVTGDEEELFDTFFETCDKKGVQGVITPYYENQFFNRYGARIDKYLINNEPLKKYRDLYGINIRKNLENDLHSVDELVISRQTNDWIIVAAGPSLDDNVDFLIKNRGKKIIIAVNTVVKKLITMGICPDLVIAVDANDQLREHIAGVEDELGDIPLLMNVLSNWKFVSAYKGPKYCFCDECTAGYVYDHGADFPLWKGTGVTVSCAAMEAAYNYGAESIYLLGLDLGYPQGKMYAEGSAHVNSTMEAEGLMIESVDGGILRTTGTFLQFKIGIERQIRIHQNVPVYNLSRHGALIQGCKK